MKRSLIVFAIVLLAGAAVASAQIPNVEFHFKHAGEAVAECGGMDVLDTAFVVVNNFSMWMSAIEYQVIYPPEMLLFLDNTTGLNLGTSATGIATSWPFPINAYSSAIVNTVWFWWKCEGCPSFNIPVQVAPHPYAGHLRAVRWPDNALINGIGITSLICPTIPTEETSWGKIKEIYK